MVGRGTCNAQAALTTVEGEVTSGDLWPHNDIRWPEHCATCGRSFDDDDHWQLFHERLYLWDSIELTLAEAPAGAMWNADWYGDTTCPPGPDGRWLHVRLPDGSDWFIDGPSSQDRNRFGVWQRSGEVPTVSVTPSVRTKEWHGFLQNGKLKKA